MAGEAELKPQYFHRDLSWLLFNRRVIAQAQDEANPLLEKLRFLGIAANNADEFFMVRVPRVQSLARLGKEADPYSGLSQSEILAEIRNRQQTNLQLQADLYEKQILELRHKGYYLKSYAELTLREHKQVRKYFYETILPIMTPVGVDAYHAFPRLREKALHFWVELADEIRGPSEALLPIAIQLPRLYQISARRFILIEEIIQHYLSEIFVGTEIKDSFVFRLTYDHDLAFQEDSEEDLSEQMADYLDERKKGLPSRLEVSGGDAHQQEAILRLLSHLNLSQQDLYQQRVPLDLTFLFSLIKPVAVKNPTWVYPEFKASLDVRYQAKQIFATLDREDILLQHPYDSFEVIIDFLKAAVEDTKTVAIKQTLYRLAPHSKIIQLLKKAAKKGIQVTVLVEIKARFDEAHNLHWVNELEAAGCFVSYGFPNMKTHSKAILVVQKDGETIKRYGQFGTGNYNENNAKIYTDLSFLTSRDEYVGDLNDFFNYLTGYRSPPTYQKIRTSPLKIRQLVLKKIDEVIAYQKRTGQGKIFAKMNALTDIPIINKLYEASVAGVNIQLQVRGACCLVPGVADLSDNIRVTSIVGRFLEHARIYNFSTSHGVECYLSSADWMTRNMQKRVEIATPLQGTDVFEKVQGMIAIYQQADLKCFMLDQQEVYHFQEGISAQNEFIRLAEKKNQQQAVLKKILYQQVQQLNDQNKSN